MVIKSLLAKTFLKKFLFNPHFLLASLWTSARFYLQIKESE